MGEPCGSWRPILDGDDAARARATVDAITTELRGAVELPGLYDGAAGRALYFGYLERAFPEAGFGAVAGAFLDQAVEAVAATETNESLFGGFTGVAWVVEHLEGGGNDANQAVDAALARLLGASPWAGDYDLMFGLTGLGLYALERLPQPSGRACLAGVVARLAELAERHHDGLAWKTRPGRVLPEGGYALGVAHGVAATIAVLAGAAAAGIAGARPLLDGAVPWLLAQQLAGGGFPDAPRGARARSAWCNGDPGVAAALLAGAQVVGETAWQEEALAIARRAAGRPLADCGVEDAALCHGAAGLAHLYNRLWHATGERIFADAARAWFVRTLALPLPDGPLGNSLWSGGCGMGLALLGAITPVEPAWDRLLVASLPPRRA